MSPWLRLWYILTGRPFKRIEDPIKRFKVVVSWMSLTDDVQEKLEKLTGYTDGWPVSQDMFFSSTEREADKIVEAIEKDHRVIDAYTEPLNSGAFFWNDQLLFIDQTCWCPKCQRPRRWRFKSDLDEFEDKYNWKANVDLVERDRGIRLCSTCDSEVVNFADITDREVMKYVKQAKSA